MFINRMMIGGKKSTASAVMYHALSLAEERSKRDAVDVLESALRNAAPAVEVKPKRVGGSTYQVPMEVEPDRPRVGDALDSGCRARPQWSQHGGKTGRGTARRAERSGRGDEEKRRNAPHGGSKPRVCALPLVVVRKK